MIRFWDFIAHRCPAAAELDRSAAEAALYVTCESDGILRHGNNVVGRVLTAGSPPSAVSVAGRFVPGPDFASYQRAFEAARDAAARVDVAPSAEYLQSWGEWKDACQAVELLGLAYGEERVPVESFGIDSDWRVDLSVPLWWLVSVGGWADAEPNAAADGGA